jgi:transcriptional regulator with PAS, ATPase and Fis domain
MSIDPSNKIKKIVNRLSGSQAAFHFEDIVGKNGDLLEAIRVASLAAGKDSNVLLSGESGTGKELFAQAIHNASYRRNEPFLAINCGAIPRELLGSELFGYVDGAFTGAKRGGRPGKFELASGGTLFLDEIGDMPLEQQVALLRVLQEKKVTRIGSDKVVPVNVRIICATNKDLQREVEKGSFRQDIYYRLNVVSIALPPLRGHDEDIELLFNHFLEMVCRKLGTGIPWVDPEVIKCLQRYDWPGNVRQLQNIVERIINLTNGNEIGMNHLPEEIVAPFLIDTKETGSPYCERNITAIRSSSKQSLREKEYEEIIQLLARNQGNVSRVAQELGVDRSTIYRRMRQATARQ